jgi:hypothetical protein
MSTKLKVMIAFGLFACAVDASAAGLIAPNTDLRQDLAWLSDRGVINISLSTWPMSQAEIESALASAHPSNDLETDTVSRIQHQLQDLKSSAFVKAQVATDHQNFPHPFAESSYSDQDLTLGGRYSSDHIDVQLQGNVEGDQQVSSTSKLNLQGSYAAVGDWNQWVSFGQISQWWGPGYDGSLIRSDAARPVTGLILQRAEQTPFETPWLSWIGRWQYQLTAGQLAQYNAIPNAKLLGARFTMLPTNFLELGASRMIQWGGDGRPQSLSSLFDAIKGTEDNKVGTGHDPSNQLGGFDFKLKLDPLIGLPTSIYGQLIGEDEAGAFPSKYCYLLGVEGHNIIGGKVVNWHVEGADTYSDFHVKGVIYTHGTYKDGYYQQGYPLGDAIGGDGKTASASGEIVLDNKNRINARLFWADVNVNSESINQAFLRADTLYGTSVGWTGQVTSKVKLGTTLWYTKGNYGHNDGVAFNVEIPINSLFY